VQDQLNFMMKPKDQEKTNEIEKINKNICLVGKTTSMPSRNLDLIRIVARLSTPFLESLCAAILCSLMTWLHEYS
jgi:hypothetical protein